MSYYVYALIDPETGAPFYIGKGKNNRVSAHEAEARKGRQSAKCDRIRAIWKKGGSVERKILFRTTCSIEALEREAVEISQIGIAHLTNVRQRGHHVGTRYDLVAKAAGALDAYKMWASRGCFRWLEVPGHGRLDMFKAANGWVMQVEEISRRIGPEKIKAMMDKRGMVFG